MERYYRFAGIEVAVCIGDGWQYDEEGALTPFSAEHVTDPNFVHFSIVDELSAPCGDLVACGRDFLAYLDGEDRISYLFAEDGEWRNAEFRILHRGKEHDVQTRIKTGKITHKMVLNALSAEHFIARNHGFLFHCAYIDHNGKAILFTAPSETGKSTQAELWNRYRGAEIINGDRAVIRLTNGTLVAEGIPFAGSSRYCKNRSLPIEAVVYLAQAPRTSIRRMTGYEAFSRIWEGICVNMWDRDDVELVSAVAQKVADKIPIYYLPCTPDEEAVAVLEEILRKQVHLR